MKKLLLLFVLSLSLISCSSLPSQEQVKKDICQELEKATGDKFYFVYGLDKERSFGTDVKYRGIIYSDRLEKMHWPEGVEIGLTSLDQPNIRTILNNYNGLLGSTNITNLIEPKARELFGEKSNFSNEGSTTEYMYDIIMNKKGKNSKDKVTYLTSTLNIFVDDLDKINITEYREKVFELGKYLYDYLNIRTALNVYVRDNKYFENYEMTYYSIYKPFREKEDIKAILNKIKKKEKINDKEKTTLVYAFNKGDLDYKVSHLKSFMFTFKYIENFPIKLKNVEYFSERKNGIDIYNFWGEEKKPKEQQHIIE